MSCYTLVLHLAQCICPLCHLVKKGHTWDWRSEWQATFKKTDLLVKQINAVGITQAGLPSELDVSDSRKYGSGTAAETREWESVPRVWDPIHPKNNSP